MPDRAPGKGKLRILLGYAAGVGKTYKMLEEAQQSKREGRDVVVGYFEPHGRADTIAKLEGLEVIPRRHLEYRGHTFEEMDTDAILARHPELCAVDEFPHTNVPGAGRAKRWEDVLVLVDAGIDVITTMNIQHLESLNDQIREITGVHVRETIPDWVIKQADEVVLVDIPPGALLNRMQRGVIYGHDKAQRAMENFFKGPSLSALREIALRQIAHEVDLRQDDPAASDAQERILIHITDAPATDALIRRGKRVADYLKAECFAVAVLPSASSSAAQVHRHLEFARKLRVETRILESDHPAEALVDFAKRNGVTQIFLAKPPRRSFWRLGKRPLVMDIVRLAQDRQVTVVAERKH